MLRINHISGSLAACCALSVSYAFFVLGEPPAWTMGPENMWIENKVLAETVLYDQQRWDVVVVGSSMSGRLPLTSRPNGIFNFALGAKGPLEGLRLLRQAHALPPLILVETNILHRSEDRAFSADLVAPVTLEAKRLIPILRNTHRPIPELSWGAYQLLRNAAGRSDEVSAPEGSTVEVAETAGVQDRPLKSELYQEMLSREIEEHAALPTAAETAETTASLIDLVAELRERGTTIVFFETPVDPTVSSSPAYAHNRGIIDKCFPVSEFRRLPIPDGQEYKTTDGVHLDSASARKFAAAIEQQLKALGLGQ